MQDDTRSLKQPRPENNPPGWLGHLWPLGLMAIAISLFFFFDLDRFVTFEALLART